MEGNSHKRRAPSSHDASSSNPFKTNHSKANSSDDAKAVELSNLWHPRLTCFVSEDPVHTEFWVKDEHYCTSDSKEPLEKGDMGPLKRCYEDPCCDGCAESNQPSTPTPTPTPIAPTTSPRARPSEYQSRQEHRDMGRVSENKHSNNNTCHNSSGAQDTRSVSVVESIAFRGSDTNNTHGSPPHQYRGPSLSILYPPSRDIRTQPQRQQSPTRASDTHFNYPPSPPAQQAQKCLEGSASHLQPPSTHRTTPTTPASPSVTSLLPDKWLESMTPSHNIHIYNPPATAQEAIPRRIANSRPPSEASYPHNLPHTSWLESFVPIQFHNNLDEALDLNSLDVAPWCGTDLVGDPRMFWAQPGQAHAQDARHSRVHKWSLEEQLMRTQWHPQRFLRRQGMRAAAWWGHELSSEEGGEDGETPVLIRDTSARLVDMVVSKEQAEEEGLFLPPVRDKYLGKHEVKQETFWSFLFRTVGVETGMFAEKDKDKKK
ncbi:hypothetical protein BGZ52_002432 [Haplosporangium bisporale]|nr:hypothetical protein BGZ52_002432 [Haplosporangium bisporale]